MALEVQRGNRVVCALKGDHGNARPAVVIQSDLFNATHASVVVCPITPHLVETPLFRLQLTST
jgi:mRNA interferase MazF